MAELEPREVQCVYFNAWKVDYITDPLIAMVSTIDKLEFKDAVAQDAYRKHLASVKKIAGWVAKRGVIAVTKALTAGALDLEEQTKRAFADFTDETIDGIVDAFSQEVDLLEKFRKELERAVRNIEQSGKHKTLVIFVDELDRCRPSFAIELLERIKHLFDVPNILFVLSIDKQQLEASTAAVYGQGINAVEYLRRFIDLDFVIPNPETKKYTASLIRRFKLDPYLESKKNFGHLHDEELLVEMLALFGDAFNLSLRARERCLTRLQLVMDQISPETPWEPIWVAFLLILRTKEKSLFDEIVSGNASATNVMDELTKKIGDQKTHLTGWDSVLYAFLFAVDKDRKRVERELERLVDKASQDDASEALKDYTDRVLEIHKQVRGSYRNLLSIAGKIDLAVSSKG